MTPDPELIVIVPSRGRPATARPLIEAFAETCTADTLLAFAVDAADPHLHDYIAATEPFTEAMLAVNYGETSMVAALNTAAESLMAWSPTTKAIGFMGDDHRPRTVGWDSAYLNALEEPGIGIVYGNDLLQGERIPTQVAMDADIVRALGHMAPPVLTHLFVDNYWRDLGRAAGCLRYLPDVVVEHVHPFAGKASMDEGYARVNAPTMYQRDSDAYADYAGSRLTADVAKVKALR